MKYTVWLVIFCVAVGIQMVLEQLNLVDSIGFWYTAYSAGINTAILFVGFVIGRFAVRKVRRSDVGPGAN